MDARFAKLKYSCRICIRMFDRKNILHFFLENVPILLKKTGFYKFRQAKPKCILVEKAVDYVHNRVYICVHFHHWTQYTEILCKNDTVFY